MTDPTLDAVHAVRDDVRALRTDLGTMVTRREHEAEVRRLDAETAGVKAALSQHEAAEDRRLTSIEESIEDGDRAILAAVEADKAERTAAATKAAEQRRADRRWSAGFVATAAGVASGVVGLILR